MNIKFNVPGKLEALLDGNIVKISSPNNQFKFDVFMKNHTPDF